MLIGFLTACMAADMADCVTMLVKDRFAELPACVAAVDEAIDDLNKAGLVTIASGCRPPRGGEPA